MPDVQIAVRFAVPLDSYGESHSGASLIFAHWLPIGRETGLTFTHEGCSGLIWFELQSSRFNRDEAEIARTVNVMAQTVFVEVVTTVDSELGGWIERRDFRKAPSADEEPLAERYLAHGKEVLAALSHGMNRFLSYIRIEKGQYWVRRIELEPGLCRRMQLV
jgi:hypothetical protein